MPERRVIVYPPSEGDGRRVRVGDEVLGTAYSLADVAEFLRRTGLNDVDALDVLESRLIERHGGGPEVWKS